MKKQKKESVKQNSLIREIVSLTVFLDAIFLVLILAIGTFLYYQNVKQNHIDVAEFQNSVITERFIEISSDIKSDVTRLAEDTNIIDYLNYINSGHTPVITDTSDSNYSIYNNFITDTNSVANYQEDNLYDLVYVATAYDCSLGSDGCAVSHEGDLSFASWSLTSRPWYSQLGENDEVFTTPYQDSLTSEPTITYISKVYDNSSLIGYVGVDISVANLDIAISNMYRDLLLDTDNQILIFSDITTNQQLVYTSNDALSDYVLTSQANFAAFDETNGYGQKGMNSLLDNYTLDTIVSKTVFNRNYDITYNELDGMNYTIVTLYQAQQILSLEQMFLIVLGFGLIMVLSILFIVSGFVKRSLSPIHQIVSTIDEIKNGNFDVNVKINRNNEFKQIGHAINIMSTEIKTQMKKTYDSLAYDMLTGLKNRASASAELDETIFQANTRSGVCLIQVDNLKNINVTKGQIIGDNLIKAIADELKKVFKNYETLFFNGGNEFIYIKEEIESLEEVEYALNRLLTHFKQPLVVKNIKTEVKLHVGVSIYPSDGNSLDELIKKCDTALFKASEEGYKKIIFYNEKIARSVSYQAEISEQLSQAINKNQLYLKYQPLVTNGNEIYGFEALARWSSPTLGEIGPQVFIANAEESYLIIPIGTWILRQACLAQVEMRNKYKQEFIMSVNVSPVQILQKDFVPIVKNIVRETDINPAYLTLEITESLFIEASILLEDTIEELHKIGIKLSLDDFGTGYASLTYLRQIAFDNLKIDKTFVDGIFANPKDHRIVATIVNLVHNLDMKVIAEGVETLKQYEYLKEIATDVFQGYIFSKPLTLEDVYKFFERFNKIPKSKRAAVFASLNE